jgi:hypothetical protein
MKFIISTHFLSFNYKANIKNILNPHERIRAGAGVECPCNVAPPGKGFVRERGFI